jgi:PP-loop superfamily ATP-utilizing enzyme
MKLEEVKKIAKQHGIQLKGMKKAEIIRAIQRNENNNDCYETGNAETCGQTDCLWRDDCR